MLFRLVFGEFATFQVFPTTFTSASPSVKQVRPPPILIMHDLFNRFGRKKTICCGLFFSAVGSFGSVVLTLFDDGESKGTDAVQ